MNKIAFPEKDCTPRCRSICHAEKILNCVCFATPSQLRSYSVWLCHNFSVVTDKLGRNLLHIASSCGKWEIVEWLIKQCGVDVNTKDLESGWTALHRSFFYGQLAAARILCTNGASLRATDHEGFTPLDILVKDRLPYIEYLPSDPCDVYVWGSNFNYNLGDGNSRSRQDPEVLEVYRKDSIDLKHVVICKFHSVFLSTCGKVYTCGYGHGGPLGQDSEDISLVPSLVKGLNSTCAQIAAGQDHLLLLLTNGQVWSCGLNTFHQLGHCPPSERLLAPKSISLKFLKGIAVCGIGAARFHSVIYTKNALYTFGLNAGQLGHPKGERTQILPRQVSGLVTEDCSLTHVETSDGATVCATSRGDVYVLHEYQIRKIASRQLEILKLAVVGGHLDSRCDVAGVREGGGLELRVALLTRFGKLYLWRQTDPYLRRCIFNSPKELVVSNVHINHYSIGIVTSYNEAYLGTVNLSKNKRSPPPPITVQTSATPKNAVGLTVLIDVEDCHYIKVKKLPFIYRATSITSDYKGRNFAVLQSNPKMGLIELPVISSSTMLADMSRLLSESHAYDEFHDVIIKVDKREFAAHKYILSSRSEYFRKRLSTEDSKNVMSIDNTKPEAFEQVLKYMYSNTCDLLTPNHEVTWVQEKENSKKSKSSDKSSKASNPIQIVKELSKRLSIHKLAKRLETVKIINGRIQVKDSDLLPRLSFSQKAFSNLCDVNLTSSDGIVFPCHKCILISRLDYFNSMLSSCWAENSLLDSLPLPISSPILKVMIDYIYTDEALEITNSEDVDFICQVLMIADEHLMPRLKEICEVALVRLISLKNAAELLELSSISNSDQLKKSSMQFICINLPAIIESKLLEVLSDDVIEELTKYYQDLVPLMGWRRILPCRRSFDENLEHLENEFPVQDDSQFEKRKLDSHESKLKRKRCTSLRSDSKQVSISDEKKKIPSPDSIVLKIVPEPITMDVPEKTPLKESIIDQKDAKKETKSPGQWVMHCVPKEAAETLDSIMNETLNFTPLQKKSSSSDKKPIPRLSQKQKKLLEAEKKKSVPIAIPSSSPSQASCPWAKLPDQSPTSPSFWDALAKKELPSSPLNRELSVPLKVVPKVESSKMNSAAVASSPITEKNQDIVINFHDIQKDEEQKLQRAINQKVKPLSILNIEDQAIEELLEFYNADNNHKEKITVIRVPKEIASPIWRKGG